MYVETWKELPNYEGRYLVSSKGQIIRKYSKEFGDQYIKVKPTGHALKKLEDDEVFICTVKPNLQKNNGYATIRLRGETKSITVGVHRLVAKTFIPNPENKPIVNHIDGNKRNNEVNNLEWVTHKENTLHYWNEREKWELMTAKINLQAIKKLIDEDTNSTKLARETGVSRQLIDKYKKGISDFDGMTLKTAIELQKYINEENAKMKLNANEVKELGALDQVGNNEKYYEFVNVKQGNKVLSYYNLFDSNLDLTRRVKVDYTDKLKGLQRIAPKSDDKAMALPYKQVELNDNYVALEETKKTLEGLESMAKSVQSEE